MQPSNVQRDAVWKLVQGNKTYRTGSLTQEEGLKIKWHSPGSAESSQIFCVSIFGSLWGLPDGAEVLRRLVGESLPHLAHVGDWRKPTFEHQDASLLGETGGGTPTSVDAFYRSTDAALCVESKFIHDAQEGFGGCAQAKSGACAGFYGPGSDAVQRTRNENAWCRLGIPDGKRSARRYWQDGRRFFQPSVFEEQGSDGVCPFAGASFQLMRNFLLAAASAPTSGQFGVMAIAPAKYASTIDGQLRQFQQDVLLPEFRSRIAAASYDKLAIMLANSPHAASRSLGQFLQDLLSHLS